MDLQFIGFKNPIFGTAEMASIGIIGYGVVGQALANGFKDGHLIKFFDKYKECDEFRQVVNSDFVFICLPTPSTSTGIDLSIMDEAMHQISELKPEGIIAIKSTIIPGTTKKYHKQYPHLRLCFNPEFLTEKNAFNDFINPDRIVIGAEDKSVLLAVEKLYKDRFPNVGVYCCDSITAEMVKYMANGLLSAKIIFANEIFDICQKLGIDYETVKKMVMADPRVGAHLDVTPTRGFGGKCFPKDIIALIGLCDELGVDARVIKAVWEKNLLIRKDHDWKRIPFAFADEIINKA